MALPCLHTAFIFGAFASFASAGGVSLILYNGKFKTNFRNGYRRGSKHPIDLETRWNFGDSLRTPLSLDEFLAQKEADGVEFFSGKEPWLKGLSKLNWQTFFRVCTQEMDDLSLKAIKLVIEYCLEILTKLKGKSQASPRWLGLRPLSTSNTPSSSKIKFSSTGGRCAIRS